MFLEMMNAVGIDSRSNRGLGLIRISIMDGLFRFPSNAVS